ncbi:MAG: DUF4010 domain-containing protein [Burkholderiales bacterium]|nr:DUF4010 domain-containing protein [Burkholderiales bacterium]
MQALLESEGLAALPALATSLAIGLLIGIERERSPYARAGLRTFALISLFGAVTALVAERAGAPWIVAAGLVLVGIAIIAAYQRAEPSVDPGTTTVVAVLLAYVLGAMCWYGEQTLAVMLAIATTALLYFKPELRGLLERFERRDIMAMLQFAALSFVVLPILPDQGYGPYGALNPYRIWLMIVLISGLSLAGYIALKLVGARHGAFALGILGGLVSSTATTLVYSRHGRQATLVGVAALVILTANLVVLVRLAVIAAIVEPRALPALLPVLGGALVAGLAGTALVWWRRLRGGGDLPTPEVKNPTELRTAFTFGAIFALVLFAAAWIPDVAGRGGLYVVALVSGLVEMDAIALSALQLFGVERIGAQETAIVIAIALASNMAFKMGIVLAVAGWRVARAVLVPAAASAAGAGVGLAFVAGGG